MTSFDACLRHLLESEGGYANNPADPGGETKYGITKRDYPSLDIRALTEQQAGEIYLRDYWRPARCDELPEVLRMVHFDCAVNCGVRTAARLLQEAAGVTIDGVIGPATLAAVQRDPWRIREEYLWLRARYYARIAARRPASREFLAGWILRLLRVRSA